MRQFTTISLTLLLAIPLGMALGRLVPMPESSSGSRHESDVPRELPCFQESADDAAPESVDDALIKRHVERDGGKLVEEGAATEMAGLIKQLGIGQCELELPAAASAPADAAVLYERAKESVVVISAIYKCDRCDNWHASCASGFVISSSGAIVTNYHVVDQAEKSGLVVMTADGQVLPVKRVLAANEVNDLAILQVAGENLKPLPLAKEPSPVGTDVAVVSHPDGRFFTYTSGVVSRYHKLHDKEGGSEAMMITADFARGSSGAPVLNKNGEVVGIVRSTRSIYYHVEDGQQKNLQMVFKTCAPAESLLRLVADGKRGN